VKENGQPNVNGTPTHLRLDEAKPMELGMLVVVGTTEQVTDLLGLSPQ
jgi:hypothetical protein